MLTCSNAVLTGVEFMMDYDDGAAFGPSVHGEVQHIPHDCVTECAPFILRTWVDFAVSRRTEMFGNKSEVQGVWEVSKFIQDRMQAAFGRQLQIGDMVKFSVRDDWFILGERSDDSGIFGSLPFQKFNLLSSQNARRR